MDELIKLKLQGCDEDVAQQACFWYQTDLSIYRGFGIFSKLCYHASLGMRRGRMFQWCQQVLQTSCDLLRSRTDTQIPKIGKCVLPTYQLITLQKGFEAVGNKLHFYDWFVKSTHLLSSEVGRLLRHIYLILVLIVSYTIPLNLDWISWLLRRRLSNQL